MSISDGFGPDIEHPMGHEDMPDFYDNTFGIEDLGEDFEGLAEMGDFDFDTLEDLELDDTDYFSSTDELAIDELMDDSEE